MRLITKISVVSFLMLYTSTSPLYVKEARAASTQDQDILAHPEIWPGKAPPASPETDPKKTDPKAKAGDKASTDEKTTQPETMPKPSSSSQKTKVKVRRRSLILDASPNTERQVPPSQQTPPQTKKQAEALVGAYTVAGVHVDISASSSMSAVDTARKEAARQAFTTVLQRLIFKDDWTKIPVFNPEIAAKAIESVEIKNAKTSQTRYIADFTISFNKPFMHKYFQDLSVRYLDQQAPKMGLILLYADDGDINSSTFCEPGNLWCQAWQNLDLKNALTPLELIANPKPYFNDPNLAKRIANKAPGVLDAVAERYQYPSLIVAILSVSATQIDIYFYHYIPLIGFTESQHKTLAAAPVGTTAPFQARSILYSLEDLWKNHKLKIEKGQDENTFEMDIDFLFNGIDEWLAMQIAFKSVPGIKGFTLVAQSMLGASVQTQYVGSLSALSKELSQRHMLITRSNGQKWVIKPLKGLLSTNVQAADDEGGATGENDETLSSDSRINDNLPADDSTLPEDSSDTDSDIDSH